MKKNTMRWFPMRIVHKGHWKEAVVVAIVFVLLSISSCTNTAHTNSGMKSDQENSQLVHRTAVSIKDVPDLPSSSLIIEEPYSIVWSYPLGEELRTSNHCTIDTVIIQDKNVLFFGVTEQTTHKDYICAFNLDTHSVQWKREILRATSEGHGCKQIIQDWCYSKKRDMSVHKATKYDETKTKDFLTADEFIEHNDMCSVQDMKG